MGFYETYYLIRALYFVPSIEGVTSNNIKKINGGWYYINTPKLEIYNYNSSDLSDVIHTVDDSKINDFEKFNSDIITENCTLKGLKLDWYIFIDGFTTLDMSGYTSLKKITNNQCLTINQETIQKFRKFDKNKKILEKMELIQKKIEQLNLEHEQLKNTLIE